MSNSMAIAAVTTTLESLIFLGIREELGSGRITSLPLDKARGNQEGNQVNIFMYHTAPDLAWQNMPRAAHNRRAATDKPPLGLDLFYMITAYGEKDSEVKSHRLLGRVMSILHDRSKLNAAEIEAATAVELPESDLHEQVEQLTIKPQHLTFEEISQVWRVFQAQYRASVAFEVSVVLLDSQLPLNFALPVLPQLPNGRGGVIAQVNPGGPQLQSILLPNRQRAVQWGDVVTLRGTGLDEEGIRVQLVHPRLSEPIILEPLIERSEKELRVRVPTPEEEPEVVSRWRAGFYRLSLVMEQGQWSSESLPLALAPKLLSVDLLTEPRGEMTLTLACTPQISEGQEVLILMGDRGMPVKEIPAATDVCSPTILRAQIPESPPGIAVVRVRIDGVDSIPVNFSARPPEFSANQTVEIMA